MTDYIDNQIMDLQLQIARLEAEKATFASGESKTFTVGMSENNSGGYYWLNDKDYDALVSLGWTNGTTAHYSRRASKSFVAVSEDHALTLAKGEFEQATGQDADAIGCTCCGRPFYFSVDPWWINDEDDDA